MANDRAEDDRLHHLIVSALLLLGLTRFATEGERPTPLDVLATTIFALNAAAFEEALRQTVAAAGGDPTTVALTNADVLAELHSAARTSAQSIAETFVTDLERMIAAAPATVAAHDLPTLIRQWAAARAGWKTTLIAITETGEATGLALREFVERSHAEGRGWFGGSLICKLCQQWAQANPYPLDAPEFSSHPHLGCLDHWEIELTSSGPLWTGD